MFLMFLILLLPVFSSAGTLDGCFSTEGSPIDHFDYSARETGLRKKILVIAGIHGDEKEANDLALQWHRRLERIKTPSNHWRIVPLLNPDGARNRTRFNSNKADLNRNFPTKDWEEVALKHWQEKQNSDPRRYPGNAPGSEAETKCAILHIEDFKPDLVVSIHTPYGQFDFDGPETKRLNSMLLPWKRLGTFPGSLGRYLWDERGIPVLTIELKPEPIDKNLNGFLKLQDLLSDLL